MGKDTRGNGRANSGPDRKGGDNNRPDAKSVMSFDSNVPGGAKATKERSDVKAEAIDPNASEKTVMASPGDTASVSSLIEAHNKAFGNLLQAPKDAAPPASAPPAKAADPDAGEKTIMVGGGGATPPKPAVSPAAAVAGKPAVSPAAAVAGKPAVSPPAAGPGKPAVAPAAAVAGKPAVSPAAAVAGKPAVSPAAAVAAKPAVSPAAAVAAKPAADTDANEKTMMAGIGSAPKAGTASAHAKDPVTGEQTIMIDPSLRATPSEPGQTSSEGPTSHPTNVENKATGFFSTQSSMPAVSTGEGLLPQGTLPKDGQRMNQYEIIRLIGEGGMGSVFLARDTKLGRRVAIKFLQSPDPELTKRFIIEARATARVEHENIVSIYEVGEWNGSPFMVLQFLQGNGLNKLIPRGKRMPVARVVELMSPVLRALAYAHAEGIVHRDLKPDNIFVTDAGVIKVLDFGIAKVAHGEDKTSDGEAKNVRAEDIQALGGDNKSMTRHGAIMGTMPYMSPEQWGNGVAIDHTTDIWAAGVIMYIMLTGKHPLDPLEGHELMVTGFLDEVTPGLKEKAPDLPSDLAAVIDKCLVKDKAQRWGDALALLRALEPFQPGRFSATTKSDRMEESPYNGLASFQEEDASRFFGRNRETAAMTQRLRERPIMAVVGPSGVGKSSFVRAGVVPALKNSGENWDISVLRPGRTPLMSLANLLSQVAGTSGNIANDINEQQGLADRLREEPGYLGTALRRQARKEKKHLLLFIDQFEELYTLVQDPKERMAFTACLSAAADDATSPMRVVVSIRSDFLDRCVEDSHFMNELSQGLFFITAPTRDGMRDALVLPAEMAGYKFENEGIVDDMLDHLAQTSGALPLLQFTADRLWADRDPSRRILTEKSYKNLGGISGALAAHADRVLEQVSGEQKALVRALLIRLVTPDRTRAIVSVDDLRETLGKSGDIQALIDQMVQARLLVVQTGGGGSGATVELVHESLIAGWPQLAKWLDEGHEDAAFLEQLRNTSRQWVAKGKDSGLLWRGEMVEEAKRFTRRFRGELPDTQKDFLKAVIAMSTRAARVKKTLYIVAATVVGIMLAAAAVALVIINESRAETRQQAVAAMAAEEKATEAAKEAEKRKIQAEAALNEARIAELAKDAAREGEVTALAEATKAKAIAEERAIAATASEAKAVAAAEEATQAKAYAEARAIEANDARNLATKAAGELKVALAENEKRRIDAERAKTVAEKRLKEMTRGGIVEVLQ